MIERRLIFPVIMFTMAGMSFTFGIWQYFYAQRVQASSAQRMAFMVKTIQQSAIASSQKQSMYATIFQKLPPAPALFRLDLSGSFASQGVDDQCPTDGQRAVCRALIASDTNQSILSAVCGLCNPR
jgi:hypothetical protein